MARVIALGDVVRTGAEALGVILIVCGALWLWFYGRDMD